MRSTRIGKHVGAVNVALAIGLLLGALASRGEAEPLDLVDRAPRQIEVRFEVSPAENPGRLDQAWSLPRSAFLEPLPGERAVRIRIPGHELEAHLRTTGMDPIPGSFSDFVWTLDPITGHVLRAETKGRVREHFRWGLVRGSTQVEIHVEMTTRGRGGFRPARRILGQATNGFCAGLEDARDCTLVEPRLFDPARGYVNAVGSLQAEAGLARIRAFSPLGEVLFGERREAGAETVVSGPSADDAVCSPQSGGLCRPGLGGESS